MRESSIMCWIDLETTGLDPQKDRILEIACVLTRGPEFEVVDACQHVTDEILKIPLSAMSDVAREMHLSNGLIVESARADKTLWQVTCDVQDLITKHSDLTDPANPTCMVLAGSSVHFDRGFLARHMSRLESWLHYRNFDVSVLDTLARTVWPTVFAGRPPKDTAHRAMPDILCSIAAARYYARMLGPQVQAVAS